MERLLAATRILLPLGLAAVAAAIQLPLGGGFELVVIGTLAGAALGTFLHLFLVSLASLMGRAPALVAGAEHLQQLERDKRIVLRTLKDIELDVALGRLVGGEAKTLSLPLRQRAMRILREIDQVRVSDARDPVIDEIERELARRVEQLEALHVEQAATEQDEAGGAA